MTDKANNAATTPSAPEPDLGTYAHQFDLLLDKPVSRWPWADSFRERAKKWRKQGDLAAQLEQEFAEYNNRQGWFNRWWYRPSKLKLVWYEHHLITQALQKALTTRAGTPGRIAALKALQALSIRRCFFLWALPKSWLTLFQSILHVCEQLLLKEPNLGGTPVFPAFVFAPQGRTSLKKREIDEKRSSQAFANSDEKVVSIEASKRIDTQLLLKRFHYSLDFLGLTGKEATQEAYQAAIDARRSALSLFIVPQPYLAYQETPDLKYGPAKRKAHALLAEADLIQTHWDTFVRLASQSISMDEQQAFSTQGHQDYVALEAEHLKVSQLLDRNNAHRERDYIYCCGFLGFGPEAKPDANTCFERQQALEAHFPANELPHLLLNNRALLQKIFGKKAPYASRPEGSITTSWLNEMFRTAQNNRKILDRKILEQNSNAKLQAKNVLPSSLKIEGTLLPVSSSVSRVDESETKAPVITVKQGTETNYPLVVANTSALPARTSKATRKKGSFWSLFGKPSPYVDKNTWCNYWIARGWLGLTKQTPETGISAEMISDAFRKIRKEVSYDNALTIETRVNALMTEHKLAETERELLHESVRDIHEDFSRRLTQHRDVLISIAITRKKPLPQLKPSKKGKDAKQTSSDPSSAEPYKQGYDEHMRFKSNEIIMELLEETRRYEEAVKARKAATKRADEAAKRANETAKRADEIRKRRKKKEERNKELEAVLAQREQSNAKIISSTALATSSATPVSLSSTPPSHQAHSKEPPADPISGLIITAQGMSTSNSEAPSSVRHHQETKIGYSSSDERTFNPVAPASPSGNSSSSSSLFVPSTSNQSLVKTTSDVKLNVVPDIESITCR